jgi:hypothetical protein
LFWKIVQFRALTEGLFPVNVMSFMFHALGCICKQIIERGPIQSTHGLHGETNIASAKRCVKVTGGTKFEQLAYKKHFNKESEIMKDFYTNFDVNNSGDKSLNKDTTTGKIIYDFDRSALKTESEENYKCKRTFILCELEFEQITHLIENNILKHYNSNKDECFINSSYYRIMTIIDKEKETVNEETKYQCIHRIDKEFKKNEIKIIYSLLADFNNNNNNESVKKKIKLSSYIDSNDSFIKFIKDNQIEDEDTYNCMLRTKNALDEKKSGMKYYSYLSKDLIHPYINRINHIMSNQEAKAKINEKPYSNSIFDDGSGNISFFDLATFNQIIKMIKNISITKFAIIKGIKHYGRGFDSSEKKYSNIFDMPSNENNFLWDNWFKSDQYSARY